MFIRFFLFWKNYRLIAVDLSKQKALDADSRAIQQIIFTGKTDNQIRVYYILEQPKECIQKKVYKKRKYIKIVLNISWRI